MILLSDDPSSSQSEYQATNLIGASVSKESWLFRLDGRGAHEIIVLWVIISGHKNKA